MLKRHKKRKKAKPITRGNSAVDALITQPHEIQKLLGLVTNQQTHLDQVLDDNEVLKKRVTELEANLIDALFESLVWQCKVNRQSRPPREDCIACGGRGIDTINMETGQVRTIRCTHC